MNDSNFIDLDQIKDKYGCVYVLIFPSEKHYIGQSTNVNQRWNCYKRLDRKIKSQHYLWNALNFYGPENVIFKILDICIDKEDLDSKEIYWMEKYNTLENGYNLKTGGSWGKHSSITKKIMSELKIGKKKSLETLKKIKGRWSGNKNPNYGKKGNKNRLWGIPLTEEVKDKISKANSGNKNGMYGRIHTGTQKEKHKNAINDHFKNKKWKWLYVLTSEFSVTIYVKNIRRFCLKENLSYGNLHAVLTGKRNKIGNWCSIRRERLNSSNNILAIDFNEFPNFLN